MAREGTLGANVRIDEKDYYAVRVSFPDLGAEAEFILDTGARDSWAATDNCCVFDQSTSTHNSFLSPPSPPSFLQRTHSGLQLGGDPAVV